MRKYWPWPVMAVLLAIIGWLAIDRSKPAISEEVSSGPMTLSVDQREDFASVLKGQGLPCALIVEARRREAQTYYVECEIYPGKLERRAYTVDMARGRAR